MTPGLVRYQINGGDYTKNKAAYGGFLYNKGRGNVSCMGASIRQHTSLEGGAIYAVDAANITWACDIVNNSAISGTAM